MKKIYAIFLSILALACTEDNIDTRECHTPATIRDLRSADGCWYVFELNSGIRLEPIRIGYCGTGGIPEEAKKDPLFNFEFVEGKKVLIGFESTKMLGTCKSADVVVKITCLSAADTTITSKD